MMGMPQMAPMPRGRDDEAGGEGGVAEELLVEERAGR